MGRPRGFMETFHALFEVVHAFEMFTPSRVAFLGRFGFEDLGGHDAG